MLNILGAKVQNLADRELFIPAVFQNHVLKIRNFVQRFWVTVRRGFFRKEKNKSKFFLNT